MTEPTAELAPPYETLLLNGKKWPVPILAPRQNRIIVPKMLEVFKGLALHLPAGWQPEAPLTSEALLGFNVSTALYDDIIEIIWLALTRAHPKILRDEVLDWPATTQDLIAALMVVMKQTGLVKTRTESEGEQRAESPQTGTA